jgi:CBS-domain-containing membrane protein
MDRVRVAFREAPAAELPVVDELGHVLGIVRREDFQRARRNGDPAETFHRPQQAVDRLDRATTLSESSSVQQAVEALVSHHSRNLVLLRDDATLAGVLTDLDLLRWVSQERRLSAR